MNFFLLSVHKEISGIKVNNWRVFVNHELAQTLRNHILCTQRTEHCQQLVNRPERLSNLESYCDVVQPLQVTGEGRVMKRVEPIPRNASFIVIREHPTQSFHISFHYLVFELEKVFRVNMELLPVIPLFEPILMQFEGFVVIFAFQPLAIFLSFCLANVFQLFCKFYCDSGVICICNYVVFFVLYFLCLFYLFLLLILIKFLVILRQNIRYVAVTVVFCRNIVCLLILLIIFC